MTAPKSSGGLLTRRISGRTVFILLLICLALLLVPMLYISRYDVPCADDFSYGLLAHRAYLSGDSVIAAAAETAGITYMTWQGSYSAVFLMCLQPAVFSEALYALTPFIMLAALLGGIFFFCYTLFGKLFGADGYSCGMIAAAASILCTQFVPSPSEAFYWYNGAVYYTFFFGVSLIVYGLIIRYAVAEKRSVALGAGITLLLIFMGGGNYITALLTAELTVCAAALPLYRKNGRWKDMLVFLAVFLAAFLISALAPGNGQRQKNFTERLGLIQTVLSCFPAAAYWCGQWFTLPVAAVLAFLIPVCGRVCLRTEYRFPCPAVLTAISFCLLSSMFCPVIFAEGAQGARPAGRIADIIFCAFIIFAAVNVFYWTGWLLRRYEKLRREPEGIKVWFVLLAALLCVGGAAMMVMRQNVTSAYAAASIYSGGARSYYETARRRLAVLKDESVRDAVLEEFEYIPTVMFFDDVTEDADDWRNIAVMSYYGKDSVTLAGGEK